MLTTRDFEDALACQNAVNADALVISLAEIVPRIWNEARLHNAGTEWVAKHPIMVLFISKIADLQSGAIYPYHIFNMAYNYCCKRAGKKWVGDIWSVSTGYQQESFDMPEMAKRDSRNRPEPEVIRKNWK
jgi:hypothetical protein